MAESVFVHEPVLLSAVERLLKFDGRAVVVDATVGQGGHARALAERLSDEGVLVGLDVDRNSLAAAAKRLEGLSCRVELVNENFGELDSVLQRLGIDGVDVVLCDLGFCSAQLTDESKGLSFMVDGPLDMRLDERLELTAEKLVNELGQDELADIIYKYGEDRKSRRIARAIVWARKQKRITRTFELVEAINRATGLAGNGRRGRIHPATRTFQALRIAVNDELGQLEKLLAVVAGRLNIAGQVAVISFHSLEDRIVKYDFRRRSEKGDYEILTRRPVVADEVERSANARSRSAKLRVARRVDPDANIGKSAKERYLEKVSRRRLEAVRKIE